MADDAVETLLARLLREGIAPLLEEDGDGLRLRDPVFPIHRNRVVAETGKALLRLRGMGRSLPDLGFPADAPERMARWLEARQNPDGSWNEIHPLAAPPGALETAFVGEFLLLLEASKGAKEPGRALRDARRHVLSQELAPGYFKKSELNYTDCLNVNASCAAFLAGLADAFGDEEARAAARRAAHRACYHQYPDGAFPYTTRERGYPYAHHLDVPCVHYQGVTLYYLRKAQRVLREPWLDAQLALGAAWLQRAQRRDGRFDWGRSGLPFAACLSGAYAFALASWTPHAADPAYARAIDGAARALDANRRGLLLRWDRASLASLPLGVGTAWRSARHGDYPLRHRAFRFGYGAWRQWARRRYSDKAEGRLFHALARLMGIKASTVEASRNFPDLFMTTEAVDCLAYALESRRRTA